MLAIVNIFILLLGAGVAWLAIASLVQKRTVKRHKQRQRSTNTAA